MPRTRIVDSLPEGEASGSETPVIDQGAVSGTTIEWRLYEDDVMVLTGSASELREMVRTWVGISSSTSSKRDESTPANSAPVLPAPAPTTESH